MSEKVFAGQRTTTYGEAKQETLRTFFHKHSLHRVVMAGPVATHLRCGLLEAEGLLERMVSDGTLRYADAQEMFHAGVTFGYVLAEALSIAS